MRSFRCGKCLYLTTNSSECTNPSCPATPYHAVTAGGKGCMGQTTTGGSAGPYVASYLDNHSGVGFTPYGGIKADDGKEPMDLISPVALSEVAKVLQFGAQKYASWNWSKGLPYTRVLAGILRHVFAYLRGEDKDPESGLSHIAHAMCGCMFILHYEKYRASFDNREKEAYKTL